VWTLRVVHYLLEKPLNRQIRLKFAPRSSHGKQHASLILVNCVNRVQLGDASKAVVRYRLAFHMHVHTYYTHVECIVLFTISVAYMSARCILLSVFLVADANRVRVIRLPVGRFWVQNPRVGGLPVGPLSKTALTCTRNDTSLKKLFAVSLIG